jgi:type II secretory ATPase GspE/PulE/Tfp pilus assembly ATPase PilB-like protein
MKIRYRIDGVLLEAALVPEGIVPAVISRVKILADLDIAERRIPQDGRIGMDVDSRHIDVRVATLPTSFGENIVMRILDQSKANIELEALGMLPQALERFTKAFSQAHGAVLVTGPTGSGKSTSLYAAVNCLNTVESNIITIEDPVEFQVGGITQVQVNPKAGLTFAAGLRSMMRCDPDIIMVGEIRDLETAEMAVQAALTGHLVLSTLHTNDAPSAVTRLLDLGVPAYLLNSTLIGVMAQRLVRTLCRHCKKADGIIDEEAWTQLIKPFKAPRPAHVYRPVGCMECRMTGYRGRTGLYEILVTDEKSRQILTDQPDLLALRRQAMKSGMRPLRLAGAMRVASGLTTMEEIVRNAPPIES